MPPKKKGKKPSGNPARGFATVSTASKPKVIVDAAASSGGGEDAKNPDSRVITAGDASSSDPQAKADAITSSSSNDTVNAKAAAVPALTPEQLEAQLRADELQLLLENNGERVKREASRNALRLRTDRNVLREQSHTVNTRLWLSDSLTSTILEQVHSECQTLNQQVDQRSRRSVLATQSDELLLKLWQLRRTLLELNFVPEGVDSALTALLESPAITAGDIAKKNTSVTWGLDQCLDWLARASSQDSLPDYFTFQNATLFKRIQDEEFRRAELMRAKLNPSAPAVELGKDVAVPTITTADDSNDITSSSEDSEDGDPERMVEKYLHIMTRLYKLKPEATVVVLDRKRRKKQVQSVTQAKADSPKTRRLLDQIKTLESDVLFDKDEAQRLWANKRVDLVIDDDRTQSTRRNNKPSDSSPQAVTDDNSASQAEPNDFIGLEGLESLSPSANDLQDQNAQESPPENMIRIRDFGKWSGVHPRRIFEETCHSRDQAAKITFSIIGKGLARRHSIDIRWSKPQDLQLEMTDDEIDIENTQQHVRLASNTLGTPSDTQSEAYIATVGLFCLFSNSTKEEKAFQRLPTVWRNLHTELREAARSRVEAEDKKDLELLRRLIESAETSCSGGAALALKDSPNDFTSESGSNAVNHEKPAVERDVDALRQLWTSKSSTPSFLKMEKTRSALPIWAFKAELLAAIDNNQAVIVCGETGCGKSTQTPSFILEHLLSQGRNCKIYCTEPRRISAISLAQRVSQELGESRGDVGTNRSLVGYSIRLESKVSSSTRLVFATTGVVMRMLERDPLLAEVTHLIIDEVHERTIDGDFLLIILRRLMVRRSELKVILMSATVNAERFSSYLSGAPIFNVPGRTYPVDVRFLEDAIEATAFGHGQNNNKSQAIFGDDSNDDAGVEDDAQSEVHSDESLAKYSVATRDVVKRYNAYAINYDLILKLLEMIARNEQYQQFNKAILVFLPGIAEIRRMADTLSGHRTFSRDWLIHPLHSTIAIEEQEKAFDIPPKGMRKIVLATNIAETGITIPDITCVVDTGTYKEMRYDERRQLSRLVQSFISKANAKQRRGRAGRVQEGLCFHLFTKARHDLLMSPQQTPEIMRLSLQDLVLRVKLCELGGVEETLSEALDAPSAKNIRRAIDYLVDVRALSSDESLTPLGRQLAKLPLDVFLGKLVLLGSVYCCMDSALSIAAILSSRSPFSSGMASRAQAEHARMGFKKGDSDLLTVYNAYCGWRRVCQTTGVSETDYCRRHSLSSQTLRNIEELKGQLAAFLVDAEFLPGSEALRQSLKRVRASSRQRNFVELPQDATANDGREAVVNSVIAWSFYPKLLAKDGKGWRNVISNQSISLHPTSVNKTGYGGRFLSYYHLMQSAAGKSYNAHETSAAEDFAVALACGDAEFKLYAGVVALDANRLRFALPGWKSIVALKHLRAHVLALLEQRFRQPGSPLTSRQRCWLRLWQRCFDERDATTR